MSWAQAFSILSDEHLWAYQEHVSDEEKERLRSMFAGSRVDSLDSQKNLICLTLSPQLQGQRGLCMASACPVEGKDGTRVTPEGGALDPEELLPLISEGALSLATDYPDTVLRIYLDPAWQALVGKLVAEGCEVVLMDRPSVGPNPAALWRYLALEEQGRAVTFMSLDALPLIDGYLKRTEALQESGLQIWRMPMDRRRNYRPIHPDGFACLRPYPARDLLCAYSWFICHPSGKIMLPTEGRLLGLEASGACERQASWTRPDLDEFFLLAALYPRMAFDGMLTLVEADDQHSRWLILDTEYSTWANAANETLFVVPLTPAAREESSSVNFRASAMLEKLFHVNCYPDHYEAWIKPEEVHSHACPCPDHSH